MLPATRRKLRREISILIPFGLSVVVPRSLTAGVSGVRQVYGFIGNYTTNSGYFGHSSIVSSACNRFQAGSQRVQSINTLTSVLRSGTTVRRCWSDLNNPPSGEPVSQTRLLPVRNPTVGRRWIVQFQPGTWRSATFVNPPSGDGGYFNSSLETWRSATSVIPPSGDGGYFNSSLETWQPRAPVPATLIPPTAVGCLPKARSAECWRTLKGSLDICAGGIQEESVGFAVGRLELNDPPASAGGIRQRARSLCRLELNDPPTAVGGMRGGSGCGDAGWTLTKCEDHHERRLCSWGFPGIARILRALRGNCSVEHGLCSASRTRSFKSLAVPGLKSCSKFGAKFTASLSDEDPKQVMLQNRFVERELQIDLLRCTLYNPATPLDPLEEVIAPAIFARRFQDCKRAL
jgi:hypothetical protein